MSRPSKPATLGLTLIFALGIARGDNVTLAWDPSPDQDVIGYKIYYHTNTPGLEAVVNVGNKTNYTVTNLTHGVTYYFWATCYNSSGLESDPSNVVEYTVPVLLSKPTNLKLK